MFSTTYGKDLHKLLGGAYLYLLNVHRSLGIFCVEKR